MSRRSEVLAKAETALKKTEIDLIDRRFRVLQFTQSEHTIEENLILQAQIIKDQRKLDNFLKSLLVNKNVDVEFRIQSEELCSKCRDLNSYTREMFKLLSKDFKSQQRKEEKQAAEVAKNKPTDYVLKLTTLFGLPSLIATVVDRLGGSKTEVGEAAGAGFAVTGAYLYKDLKKDENLRRLISSTPALIKKGAYDVYYCETAMNSRVGVMLAFQSGKETIGTGVVKTSRGTMKLISKFSRKNDIQP